MMGFLKQIKRVSLALVFIYIVFFTYQYFFGHMYGGLYYQKQSFTAEARLLLKQYYNEQQQYYEINRRYSPTMHKESKYSGTHFRLDIASDNELVKIACSKCIINNDSYTVAALGEYKNKAIVLSIDSSGCIYDHIEKIAITKNCK